MLVDILSVWGQKLGAFIILIYDYIFPEFPKIGWAISITGLLFFLAYAARGKVQPGVKIAGTTLLTLTFLVYCLHWLIKLYHVVV